MSEFYPLSLITVMFPLLEAKHSNILHLTVKQEVTNTLTLSQLLRFTFTLRLSFFNCSHFCDVHRVVDVDHLEAQVVDAPLFLVVVFPLVRVRLKAVDAVWRGDPNTF